MRASANANEHSPYDYARAVPLLFADSTSRFRVIGPTNLQISAQVFLGLACALYDANIQFPVKRMFCAFSTHKTRS